MPVELADELAAVLMPELDRDISGVVFQMVPGVPAEVMASSGVESTLPRPGVEPVPQPEARLRGVGLTDLGAPR